MHAAVRTILLSLVVGGGTALANRGIAYADNPPGGAGPPVTAWNAGDGTLSVSASQQSRSSGSGGPAGSGGGGERASTDDGTPAALMPCQLFVSGGLVAAPSTGCTPGPAPPTAAPPAPPAVDPLILAQEARNQLVLPSPTIHTAPPSGRLVVQWQTWLWMDPGAWGPLSATASAGSVSATVTARPVRVRWDMGDGQVIVCDSPGTAWQPGVPAAQQHPSCSYVYRRSSAGQPNNSYVIRTSIDWSTSWVAAGAPGGGVLDPAVTTGSLPVQVVEVQALVTD
jgi:hypothetical protein